ncbi:MAG: substrate-binding domain-containing protein [Lachnospiraceae bacterium]|nr:substrate-binding domain-containing protein [Lachnospiraceae bacterium]
MDRKTRWLVPAVWLICLFLSGCSWGSTAAVEKEQSRQLEIGFLFDTFTLERWQRDRDIFVSAASELGAVVNVQNANGDIMEQKEQFRYFINKKVDAIVLVQVADETTTLRPEIEMAKAEGIPVIAYDRLVLDADVDLYISFDNEQVGRMMAAHMIAHVQEGKILMVNGPLSDYNCVQIEKGFLSSMEESGNKLQLAGIEHAEGWVAEYGFTCTEEYLKRGTNLKGVMGGNDGVAGEILTALSENRLAGSVCVVGQDADLAACQRIVEGTQCMTVYKPIEKLARKAAELAVTLARRQAIQEELTVIHDGSYEVPFCKLQPIAVTKGNMDEYITGQYHAEEDIYLNVVN